MTDDDDGCGDGIDRDMKTTTDSSMASVLCSYELAVEHSGACFQIKWSKCRAKFLGLFST